MVQYHREEKKRPIALNEKIKILFLLMALKRRHLQIFILECVKDFFSCVVISY